jgi:phosphate-selective porin OprO/OprP
MKDRSIKVVAKVLFMSLLLCVVPGRVIWAADDTDARIKSLETQLKSLQAELAKVKAERGTPDKRQVEQAVNQVLAKRPRPEMGPTDLRAYWKEGLRLDSGDGNFKLKIGGRIQNDFMWASEDNDVKNDTVVPSGGSAIGDQHDGAEFRRVRLYTSGLVYGNVEFKLQFDFAGGDADLKDAFLSFTDFPYSGLKVGHFKEPFSLDELTSSKYIMFMERALPNAFAPGRNVGVMLFDTAYDERMTWAAGLFRDADDNGTVTDDGSYSLTARVTGLPWYDPSEASLLHVGAAVSSRNTGGESTSFSSSPEAHLFDTIVDTNSFGSDHVELLGLETAWVKGPLSLQGEYIFASADQQTTSGSNNFDGYYVQASYFLTGEHRNYKPSAGAFSRVKPKENFSFGGGLGAWEVAVRYSELDLDDSLDGGEVDDISAGLNWYLNPNTRLMWNYIHMDKDNVGDADILMMRLQIDF